MTYAPDRLFEEIAYIAYHFHWSLDEILDLADVVVTMFAGEIVRVLPRRHVTAASVLTDTTHGRQAVEVSA